jgi:hypothetical protein
MVEKLLVKRGGMENVNSGIIGIKVSSHELVDS